MATATTATTAPEMEHRALLALLARVREGPDEAAAAAVTAFAGDINACFVDETVLHAAVYCGRPLTVAALAARGDCNPNVVSRYGVPMLCLLLGPYKYRNRTDMATFLAHFPTVNINACDEAGDTPLHYAAVGDDTINVQLLLDAGADPTMRSLKGFTPAEDAHQWGYRWGWGYKGCTKLLEAAEAWHSGLRRGWLRAVVSTSKT